MESPEDAGRLYEDGLDAYRAGEYEEALEAFARARSLFSEAGDRSAEASVLNDMGVVYVQLEAWDKAQQALDSSLAIRQELTDRSGEAMTWGNMGMLYARQGDDEEAVKAYEQSIAIFRELGERGNEKAISRQLSKLKIQKGKFLDALSDYQEDLEGEESPSGAQRMARKLFRMLGRLAGGPSGDVEDEDVLDLLPEPDEEE